MVIAPAIIAAVIGLARLIAWLLSITFISSYIRDVVTKSEESTIQQSEDAALTTILNNPALTPDQKSEAVMKYLNVQQLEGQGKPMDWQSTMILLGALAVGGYVLANFIGGRR